MTAASITVDWRALKFYLFFYARSAVSTLLSSRAGTKIRAYAAAMTATLAGRQAAAGSVGVDVGENNTRGADGAHLSGGSDNNSRSDSEDEPFAVSLQCTTCGSSPAEVGAHIYICFDCLWRF